MLGHDMDVQISYLFLITCWKEIEKGMILLIKTLNIEQLLFCLFLSILGISKKGELNIKK